MNKNIVVVGTQWGDEGKGKIVDWLAEKAGGVVRFQGGHNAGHTLVVKDKVYKLNLIPSGIVHPDVNCYIGNGVVLDLSHLVFEINKLENDGIQVKNRLKISPGCVLILPYHIALDHAREASKSKDLKIGTTGKGIGPTYEDKVSRHAIRLYDLYNQEQLSLKLKTNVNYYNHILTNFFNEKPLAYETILKNLLGYADILKPMLSDISSDLYKLNEDGESILFEGAQGSLLDIDHGTYPFVTSSNCVAGQAAAGTGIGPSMLHYVLGITKAYCTRVGSGPFPSELDIETENTPGHQMSSKGKEFGTVTGRKRRCGWLDIPALKRSKQINGLSGICITKLDVLDGLSEIRICTSYLLHNKKIDILPLGAEDVANCIPIYESMSGWQGSTVGVTSKDKLPIEAQNYLNRIEALSNLHIDIVSTGPEESETILMTDILNNA